VVFGNAFLPDVDVGVMRRVSGRGRVMREKFRQGGRSVV
jgi:hypothetical protein